jgi:hypothetical protein
LLLQAGQLSSQAAALLAHSGQNKLIRLLTLLQQLQSSI